MARVQNPVIVVPGITATSMHDDYPPVTRDVWTMVLNREYTRLSLHPDDARYETKEPAHVYPGRLFGQIYDDLIEALRYELSESYDRRTPVFAFPYDWRRDLRETAGELRLFVEEVIARTKLLRHYVGYEETEKVDLVGHSMGGLLIGEYLHQFGKEKRVEKVATLGTPYRGSIEAIVKLATGMGNLSGSKPTEREREAARTLPAIYQLLPSYDSAITPEGTDLFDVDVWQEGVLQSLAEYVRLHSVRDFKTKKQRRVRARAILGAYLQGARDQRQHVESLKPSAAGLPPDSWLAIIGAGAKTRLKIEVKRTGRKPRFAIPYDPDEDAWSADRSSRRTGDGTVPLAGALPAFLPAAKPVVVCPDDFGRIEFGDRMTLRMAGFHALLPNLNLAQRLVVKHFYPAYRGQVWGRRVPGAESWEPPIKNLDRTERE